MKDGYSILGVLPSIEAEALRPIYVALIKKYHPDLFKGDVTIAEAKTKELNEAYSILSDPELRKKFDEQFSIHQGERTEPTSANSKSESMIDFGSKRSHKNTIIFSREAISKLLDQYSTKEMGFFILSFGQTLFIQHGSLDGWLANVDVGNSGNPFLAAHTKRLVAAGFILDDDLMVFSKKFSILPYDKVGAMKAIFEAAEGIGVTEGTLADLEIDEDHLLKTAEDNFGERSSQQKKKGKNEKSASSTIFWFMVIAIVFIVGSAIPANFLTIKGIFF